MNQELQEKIIEYLGSGEAFLKEQAPDFVKQALSFYAWNVQFSIWTTGGFSLLLLMAVLFFVYKWLHDGDEFGCIAGFFIFVFFCISCCGFFFSIEQAKKIELAPKLFLLQEMTKK